jgi:hypothetical protein
MQNMALTKDVLAKSATASVCVLNDVQKLQFAGLANNLRSPLLGTLDTPYTHIMCGVWVDSCISDTCLNHSE